MNHRDAQARRLRRGAGSHRTPPNLKDSLEVGVDSPKNFYQCAFASPIFPGQHMHLTAQDLELHIPQYRDRAKILADPDHPDQWDRGCAHQFLNPVPFNASSRS